MQNEYFRSNGYRDVADSVMSITLCWWLFNVKNQSPTSRSCHQHKPSTTSVTNIDVAHKPFQNVKIDILGRNENELSIETSTVILLTLWSWELVTCHQHIQLLPSVSNIACNRTGIKIVAIFCVFVNTAAIIDQKRFADSFEIVHPHWSPNKSLFDWLKYNLFISNSFLKSFLKLTFAILYFRH